MSQVLLEEEIKRVKFSKKRENSQTEKHDCIKKERKGENEEALDAEGDVTIVGHKWKRCKMVNGARGRGKWRKMVIDIEGK